MQGVDMPAEENTRPDEIQKDSQSLKIYLQNPQKKLSSKERTKGKVKNAYKTGDKISLSKISRSTK